MTNTEKTNGAPEGLSDSKAMLADMRYTLRVLEDTLRSKNMQLEELERAKLTISKVLQVRDDVYTQLQIINVFDTDSGKVIYVG